MVILILCIILMVIALLIFIGCTVYHRRHCFWATVLFTPSTTGNLSLPTLGHKWENKFIVLGSEVDHQFNLSNCWVCGGPTGLESWPWTAVPISPEWL